MSIIPIDLSPDLQRLREDGYNIQVTPAGFLVVRDVPYVNSRREIAYGVLGSKLELAGDITTQPQDHTAKFVGDYPCDDKEPYSNYDCDWLRNGSANFIVLGAIE